MSKRLSVALAVWLFAQPASAQTTVDLSLDQAREVATQALLAGDAEVAIGIAEAVLASIPDDRASLLVVAGAAPRLGDAAKGRRAGARAWAVSTTDIQKYEAARLTALAAASEGRFTLSTFWLRRALTVAPNEDERAQTIKDAGIVKQRNPWATQLSFSLVPSNNINGGAEDASSTAPGNPTGTLSEDALALRGWRASFSFGAQYRLRESQRSRTTVGLQYQLARVRITDSTAIPEEAFATDYLDVSMRHDIALENGTVTFRASRGRLEYRDLDLATQTTEYDKYDISRIALDRRAPLNERTLLSLSASREWLTYQSVGIGEVQRTILTGGLTYQLDGGNQISGTLSVVNSDGDSVNFTSQDQTISGSYSWAEPLGAISLSVGGGFKWSDFPDYRLLTPVTGGRQDRTAFASANIGFPGVEYAGFTPGLRIDASKTDSNVSRFDRTTFSAGLTINSSF